MRGLNRHPAKVLFVEIRAVGSNPTLTAIYGSTLADLTRVQSLESKVQFLKGLPYNGVSSVVVAQLSVKQLERVRFPLSPHVVFCPGDGIGIRVGLRSQILGVRVSSGAPSFQRLWRNR
jgi:hypothetical protein